ncbi:hypothetical protein V8E52_001914 [Russula decolorans]
MSLATRSLGWMLSTPAQYTSLQALLKLWDSSSSPGATQHNTSLLRLTLAIQHAKRDPTLVGFKRTQHLILEAIKRPRNTNEDLKSIKFQRAESKIAALQAWEQRFYDTPHTSQVYDSALTSPPDGRPHTILRMASTGIRIKGEKFVHHIPRDIQSTLFRLITGHAFTGTYRLKFKRPNLPPATEEEIAWSLTILCDVWAYYDSLKPPEFASNREPPGNRDEGQRGIFLERLLSKKQG